MFSCSGSVLILMFAALGLVIGQRYPIDSMVLYGLEKPGDCPPRLGVGVCEYTCDRDDLCDGQQKCCPTACGGTVCIMPVTMRRANLRTEKPGYCPQRPTGRWVCSSSCQFDSDCRGSLKCCTGRCPGSMVCQKPEV